MTETTRRARVLVVSLGGTIASTSTDAHQGVVPQLGARELIAAVPQLSEVADVETLAFLQLPSCDLTLADVVALARRIDQAVAAGVDGVVVTQGTDTIEETSFALDLLVEGATPVVVTGAMRNPTVASPDGPGNLLAAVRVAASTAARGLGCLVVLNDEVHAARFVRKSHSSSLATFQSPGAGALGRVSEENVRIALRCPPLAHVGLVGEVVPDVALLSCVLGDDGRLAGALGRSGYRGAVIDGFGGGHVPSSMVPALEELRRAMPVVFCSRTGSGEVLAHTYGFAGSEMDLLARGLVAGGALDGRKARVALALALARAHDDESAIDLFCAVRDSLSSN
ncbi:MAG: asparaginase [Acidobacteriota bacterium]|nr:asparaginase [Acidobacteriota bacterium]MDE3031443.1 asparaginase [Acidobacteriota bacterium]MDE3093075.1 asparaginase [Acidobacteriota bacterium]MDE3147043.1 asparaginase [Acidobacteriota bacterium]